MGFVLSGAVVVMSLAASATTLECQVITKVMNKLGYQMSVYRHRIATSTDEDVVRSSSAALAKDTTRYREAKKGYKKARCKGVWDD